MTPNQFMHLPLGVNLTMNELLTIHHSLYTLWKEQIKKRDFEDAQKTSDFMDKLEKIINTYQDI